MGPSNLTQMPGQSATRLQPGFAGSTMQVWPEVHCGRPRLPQRVEVGLGGLVDVGVGHFFAILYINMIGLARVLPEMEGGGRENSAYLGCWFDPAALRTIYCVGVLTGASLGHDDGMSVRRDARNL